MIIAVSATGSQQTAPVDPRFGRAPFFVIVDSESGAVVSILNNSGNRATMSGAGISSAQSIVDSGVEAVITGQIGPKASQVLSAAGISVFAGAQGSVADAVTAYQSGQVDAADTLAGRGPGGRQGTGRGMSRGTGRR